MDLRKHSIWFLSCCAQLVATFWLLSGYVCAVETDGANINAVRMLSSSSTSALIEVEYSLDTSHRMATVVGLAYSDDRTKMTQRGDSTPVVGPGRNAKVLITVMRPAEPAEHVTHKLLVTIHVVETMTRFRRSFDLSIKWPEVSEIGSQSASAQYIFDTSALNWISRNYLIEEDFAALDNILTQWNDSSKRDIDGEWKLSHFARGLQEEFQDKNWKANSERLRQWRRSSPKSIALALTEASYWLIYGNSVLGSEYRKSTDAFARQLAKERLRKGEKTLLNAKRYAANCPVWYEIFIAISTGLQRDDNFMQQLFAEAITKHPAYSQIYIAMNKYLAPVSKPKIAWDDVDEVIAKGVRNTQTTEGNIGYANFYLAITYSRIESFNLLRDTLASWPKLRAAMEERAKRFPSPSNLNELAGYACIAEDSAAYLKIRPHITYIVPEVWRSNYSPDLCDRRFLKFL